MDAWNAWKRIMLNLREINMKIMKPTAKNAGRFGLSPSQMMAVMILFKEGKMTVTALSNKMYMPPSNISGIGKRLESMGLVSRERDKADQRIVNMTLTKKAEDIARSVEAEMDGMRGRLLSLADENDTAVITEGMERLIQLLDRVEEQENGGKQL